MSSFKQGALVLSNKPSAVPPTNSGETSVVSRDGNLFKYYNGNEYQIVTADISGSCSCGQSAVDITTTPSYNNSGTTVQSQLDNINSAIANVFFMGRLLLIGTLFSEEFPRDSIITTPSPTTLDTAYFSEEFPRDSIITTPSPTLIVDYTLLSF